MNEDDVGEWDGAVLGPDPPVILVTDTPESGTARLVVGSVDGPVFGLPAGRVLAFLEVHPAVISAGLDPTLDVLGTAPNCAVVGAVLAHAAEGRWIDLGLHDQLHRIAVGVAVYGTRSEEDLGGRAPEFRPGPGVKASPIGEVPYQKLPFRDRIGRLWDVCKGLAAEMPRLSAEVERPWRPEYRLPPLPRTEAERLRSLVADKVRALAVRPDVPAADPPREGPGHGARGGSDPRAAGGDDRAPDDAFPTAPGRPLLVPAHGGFRTALRGAVTLKAISARADRMTAAELGRLLETAEDRYRHAAGVLRRCPEVRTVFHWRGEDIPREKGRVRETKAVRGWLRSAARRLVDRWHHPVMVPPGADGEPTRHPERWGCWAGCDRAVWGWRELHRAAEVIRFASADSAPTPRYETLPRLRSFEPNLEAYRRLGVPVFRPKPGRVFVAGRVRDLRLRAFAAVGLRRGYFTPKTSRLIGHFLDEEDPLAAIAEEFFVACDLAGVGGNAGRPVPPGEAAARRAGEPPRDDSRRRAAEARYAGLQVDRPDEAGLWVRRARGLLDAAILGLPDDVLPVFLECEYQDPDLARTRAARALGLLASGVVPELGPHLDNRLTGVVWARLGRSAQDELRRQLASARPENFPAQVRNTLQRAGVEGLGLPDDPFPPAGGAGPPGAAVDGRGLFLVRGRTLGGRLTAPGSQPVVRQDEVLVSADEVMFEVAHALVTGGYDLRAVAGEEFLVEAPEREAAVATAAVREAATGGAARLLGRLADAVAVEACDRW